MAAACRRAAIGAAAGSAGRGQPRDCASQRAAKASTCPATASPVTRARCAWLRSRYNAVASAEGRTWPSSISRFIAGRTRSAEPRGPPPPATGRLPLRGAGQEIGAARRLGGRPRIKVAGGPSEARQRA